MSRPLPRLALVALVAFDFTFTLAPREARANDAAPEPAPAPLPSPAPLPAPLPSLTAPPPPPGALPRARAAFAVSPLTDGIFITVAMGLGVLLDGLKATGEIRPQQISRTFDTSDLLGIDRVAVRQTVDPNASHLSNIGVVAAASFAVLDPVLTAFREKNVQAGITDAALYAESFAMTFAMTNMVKMAVRRPRPGAYLEAEANRDDPAYANARTDSALSFFSGHTSAAASIGATATYLAFARSPRTLRPWITLALSVGVTTFVGVERVRAGAHFPTDVLAGGIAGAGIGVLVPHLHRADGAGGARGTRTWVGFAPAERGEGGRATLSGVF